MVRSITVGGILLATLVGGGCGAGSRLYGTWEGQRTGLTQPGTPEYIARTVGRIRITLKRDGSFEMVEAGFPKTGQAVVRGEKATLKIERILDKPVEGLGKGAELMNKDMTLEMQSDGSAVFKDPGGFHPEPVQMKRVPQPK